MTAPRMSRSTLWKILSHGAVASTFAGSLLLGAGAGAAPPPLPTVCSAAAACGSSGLTTFVTQGSATVNTTGNTMTVNQQSGSAVLNWANFNIASGNTVNFVQPTSSAIALNRIFQADASQIFGSLNANGTVYLLNQNGFLFGKGSVVNVGGLVASSLNISPEALSLGIAGASNLQQAAFEPYTDAQGNTLMSGNVLVQNGAKINAPGGQVFLFAPNVENDGQISTPDGQTILGAGQRIFLAASTDPNVRGLLIEVGQGGTVTNGGSDSVGGGIGEIVADRGNVTLAGLAVNQNGRVSATTTVNTNGSIILKARDTAATALTTPGNLQYDETGTVILGPGSSTQVTLEGSAKQTAVDVTPQPKSQITVAGNDVLVEDGASIIATGGNVSLTATGPLGIVPGAPPDAARIYLAPESTIDVSGATDVLPVSDNSLAVQLRGTELADDPAQRDGALHGLTVYVDLRLHGVNPDGSLWVGTPIANLLGDVSAIPHDVFYRNLTAGSVSLTSSGSILQSQGSKINISGGAIDWQSGFVKTSVLLGTNGVTYGIGSANPDQGYVGTLDSVGTSDLHWGTTVSAAQFGKNPKGTYTPGYVQGFDAGSVTVVAPNVVLAGAVDGAVQVGPYQINPTGAIPAGQLYRFADQVPLGGTLIVGNSGAVGDVTQSEIVGAVTISPAASLSGLKNAAGGTFDPTVDVLPSGFVSEVASSIVGSGGVSNLSVYSTGEIVLPAGVTLSTGAGGSVALVGGRVTLDGSISSPAGSVLLEALPTQLYNYTLGLPLPQVALSATSVVDVSGEWINNSGLLLASGSSPQNLPLWINGGSVSIVSQQGSIVLPVGSAVSANGGAVRNATGVVKGGSGGSIKISDTAGAAAGSPDLDIEVDATLSGFALANGGSLSIGVPTGCLSSVGCTEATALRLDPSLLTDDGFAKVTLGATGGDFTVESDVYVAVQQQNWQLLGSSAFAPSAIDLSGLVTTTLLPDYVRAPASVRFFSTSASQTYGDLRIAAGAIVGTDPLGSITLSTDSRIFDDGTLIAPGGRVSLSISGSPSGQYLADQAIWLGTGAAVIVSGTTIYKPNAIGLLQGQVLDGGSVTLAANSGYLYAQPGSVILADGTASELDLPTSWSGGAYQRVNVGSAGGSITLFGAEGLQIDAQLSAAAGNGTSLLGTLPAGGTLTVQLDGNLGSPGARIDQFYPSPTPVLGVTMDDTPMVIAEGAAAPSALEGVGRIPASIISGGGFDRINLSAANLTTNSGSSLHTAALGVVALDSGVTLQPGISLTVSASQIEGLGDGTVTLAAPLVTLGNLDARNQDFNPTPATGAASLAVYGGVVDLVGSFGLGGFASTVVQAATDLRLIGVQSPGSTAFKGQLVSGASLSLVAQQIYPTTLTDYTISLPTNDSVNGVLSIQGLAGTPAAVLSAAGSVTFNATEIDDAGTVLAPFGTIAMNAQSLNLLAGSVTSVSGHGLTIPFGETQGGLDWVYPLNGAVTQVYSVASGNSALPPQKQVLLNGANVNIASGARVDVAGNGDLQAFEFTAGLGGSNDVLSNVVSPNLYAIVPSLNLPVAPIDPLYSQGFGVAPGTSIYLSGGGGLAAGVYTLLPARYALLPGAFLVEAVGGYQDLPAGSSFTQLNGGTIMAGALLYGDSGIGVTRTSGYEVFSGSYAFKQASYTLTSANTFFANQAASLGVAAPRLPEDAGTLSIAASVSATLAGALDASHPTNGSRGGVVDIAGANLLITDGSVTVPAGYLALDAQQLDALGAERLVLGATEVASVAGDSLNIGAANVLVAGGATLTGQEIVLAAQNTVQVLDSASILASGAAVRAEPALLLPAGAALLEATTGPAPLLVGSSLGAGAGAITVGSGATLSATGALAFNSSGTLQLAGSLHASGATVEFGAPQVALGSAPSGYSGLALTPALLGSLGTSRIELASPNAVQVYGSDTVSLSELSLSAPGLVLEGSGSSLAVTADRITLGSPSATTVAPTAGDGSVTFTAGTIQLSGGAFSISGATSTNLNASTAVVATGSGNLSTSGDLSIATPRLVASGAYDTTLSAAGQLAMVGAPASGAAPQAAAGASFAFNGTSVSIATEVASPSGLITATASAGDVVLASGAFLNVGGFDKNFNGTVQSAPGGRVDLAASGNVTIDAGTTIDVSAGGGHGTGGALSLVAPHGTVTLAGTFIGAGGTGEAGAALAIDANAFDPNAVLGLNASNGFTGDVGLRLRGPGDLVVPTGDTLRATGVNLDADQGSIVVSGTIDVSQPLGGTVSLAASNNVEVAGSLLAQATASADRGGRISLSSSAGGVYVDSGAVLSLGGTSGSGSTAVVTDTGSLWISAPRSAVLSALNSDPAQRQLVVAGTVTGASHVVVEGVQSYASSGTIDGNTVLADPSNPIYADAAAFVNNAGGVAIALGLPSAQVVPGVELASPGDLTVASAWDLSGWRFGAAGDVPGVLTLRAAGNLYVNQSISDGFAGVGAQSLSPNFGGSWSYRLVAGADLAAANPLATEALVDVTAGSGDVVVAPGIPVAVGSPGTPTVIRTGTGFIDIAAAEDLILGNQASVIYTAGVADPNGRPLSDRESGFRGYAYPTGGGDVSIVVGRDVVGAPSDQLFSDWLWRAGVAPVGGARYVPTAWTIAFGDFQQGIAAFGGGDVTIVAGRDVRDLNANVPTIGMPVGDGTAAGTATQVIGDGLLRVTAGRDVLGGKFLGMGAGIDVSAGGGLYAGSPINGYTALNPIFAIASDTVDITTRLDANIETILDPTLLPRSLLQPLRSQQNPQFFSTYSDASAADVLAVGGDVDFSTRTLFLELSSPNLVFNNFFASFDTALRAYAPTLEAVALSGNIHVDNSIDFVPAAHGTLGLYAGGSILIGSLTEKGGIHLTQSDIDPSLLGSVAAPTNQLPGLDLLDTNTYFQPGAHAPTPIHGGGYSVDGQADTVVNTLVALSGDVSMEPADVGSTSLILSAKPIDIYAGRDIVDLGLQAQNLAQTSVDTITAGRDVIYTAGRTPNGAIIGNTRFIDVAGPGALLVNAGRNVNLQTSAGITSSGNLSNAALPSTGADLAVIAGARGGAQYNAFEVKYLEDSTTYDKSLSAYIDLLTGETPPDKATALIEFKGLTGAQQARFLDWIFVSEVREGGRSAAAAGAGHNDFTRAFAALETLFPGSNPNLGKGETNADQGDILLYFSRIYTLAGGDVDLFAPGGQVNVGLAAAPTSFGINKVPSQLGIVAQQVGSVSIVAYNDVQVNQSRIFAADGGDILIWSTEGNIDAGRGAKSAISAPPPIITIGADGRVTTQFPAALTGSGIQTLATTPGVDPGSVDLFAPRGVVNANDAGIVAGNLTIAATAVLGTNNITVSGTSVGVPVQASGLGASVAGAASSGTAATNVGQAGGEGGERASKSAVTQAALNYLDVVVVGLGEEGCKPDDVECMRRQKHN